MGMQFKFRYLPIFFVAVCVFAQPPQTEFSDNAENAVVIGQNKDNQPNQDVVKSPREQAADELDALLMSGDYSDAQTIDVPKKNNTEAPSDLSWLGRLLEQMADFGEAISETVGVLGKVLSILLLVLVAWLLYQKRHVWLKLFDRMGIQTNTPANSPSQIKHFEAQKLWQSLPPKDELLSVLQDLLQKKQWLLALALLYQGTLREMALIYDLPIDNHQTEDECLWLLARANQHNQKEKQYFENLVALWRASAYGKKIPTQIALGDYSSILQLMSDWSMLYEQRGR